MIYNNYLKLAQLLPIVNMTSYNPPLHQRHSLGIGVQYFPVIHMEKSVQYIAVPNSQTQVISPHTHSVFLTWLKNKTVYGHLKNKTSCI